MIEIAWSFLFLMIKRELLNKKLEKNFIVKTYKIFTALE